MKNRQLYLSGIYKEKDRKVDTRRKIAIPLDIAVLASVIGVIMLTISFSLGVEKGKRAAYLNIANYQETINQSKFKVSANKAISDKLSDEKGSTAEKKNIENVSKDQAYTSKPQITESDVKEKIEYKIQVASFYKENAATKEAERLKEKGYPAKVEKKGKYAVVYVGNFDNESKAREYLRSLRKTYKDCILRRL